MVILCLTASFNTNANTCEDTDGSTINNACTFVLCNVKAVFFNTSENAVTCGNASVQPNDIALKIGDAQALIMRQNGSGNHTGIAIEEKITVIVMGDSKQKTAHIMCDDKSSMKDVLTSDVLCFQ